MYRPNLIHDNSINIIALSINRKSMNSVILPRRNLKTVSFGISLPIGSAFEPVPGITTVLFDHLERNTVKQSEDELALTIDDHGFVIFSDVSRSSLTMGMTTPPQNLEKALSIFHEMLFEPGFKEDTVQKIIQKQTGGLQQIRSTPESILSNYTKWETAFGSDPITKHPQGTMEGLKEISVDKLESWYKEILTYQPNFAAVGVDIDESKFKAKGLDDILSQFGNNNQSQVPVSPSIKSLEKKVDQPAMESANAYIGVNIRGPVPDTQDFSFDLFRTVVDGGMSSRMFNEIREQRNLSYAPRMSPAKFAGGSLYTAMMDVRPDKSEEALETTLNLLKQVMTEPISEEEMKRSLKISQQIAVFVSDFSRSYANFILGRIVSGQEYDLEKIKQGLQTASTSNWQENVLSYWKPENLSFAVSGDAGNVEYAWLSLIEKVL